MECAGIKPHGFSLDERGENSRGPDTVTPDDVTKGNVKNVSPGVGTQTPQTLVSLVSTPSSSKARLFCSLARINNLHLSLA